MTLKQCEVCGADHRPQSGALKRGGGKYCSRACYYAAKTTRVELPCEVCATPFVAFRSKIAQGNARYCSRECTAEAKRKANAVKANPAYQCWRAMHKRCHNAKGSNYPLYGGRGITVCDRWLNNFQAFLADMGPRPDGMTLDRIDTDGNYEPGNCRWADLRTQAQNRRNSISIEYGGQTYNLTAFARDKGLDCAKLRHLVCKKGLSAEQATAMMRAGIEASQIASASS